MKKAQGFTLLELLIVVVILGVLALIAAPTLLNAADRAKEGAVKANSSSAASTVTTYLAVGDADGPMDGDTAASTAITDLNNGGDATADTDDDAKSPFDATLAAYADAAGVGIVTLVGDADENFVTITGYGKDGSTALVTKTVRAPEEAAS